MNCCLLAAFCLAWSPDSLNCRMVGHWPFGQGYMPSVAVSDTLIYVAAGGGMYILDVSDASAITLVAENPSVSPSFISRHGNRLCAGEGETGVALYDISDLRHAVLLGRYDDEGAIYGVKFDGRYAFVADYEGSMKILDFENPAAPLLVGSCTLPEGAVDIAVACSVACVTAGDALCLVDVSDLFNPVHTGTYSRSRENARFVRLVDTVACVTFLQGGLVILSTSDPSQPRELSRFSGPGGADDLAVQDSLVLVETRGFPRSIKALSIADPTSPRVLGTFPSPIWDADFKGLAISGQRCYTHWDRDPLDSLMVLDISNPARIGVLGTYSGIPALTDDVFVAGPLLLAGTRGDGLKLFDVSDPRTPVLLGQVCDTTRVGRLCARDSIAYLACWHASFFKVVDFSDPHRPVQVGILDTFGFAQDVDIQGSYAFLAEGENLRIIDVSDPAQPRQTARLELPSGAFGVDAVDSFCYIADWYGGIRVVEVSDPLRPTEVASFATPCSAAVDVCVQQQYLFYADVGGFGVLDVGKPRAPKSLAFIWTVPYHENWGLDIHGNSLVVAQSNGGIKVCDVTDPALPVEVGRYNTPDWTYHVHQSGDLIYAADCSGFMIIEYLEPGLAEERQPNSGQSDALRVAYLPSLGVIRLNLSTHARATVLIVDSSGQTLLARALGPDWPSAPAVEIDVSDLPSGAYVVRVESDGRVASGRFVVAR